MATPLLQQFPSLAAYPVAFLKDMLSSPELTEAFLFSLPEVQELAAQVETLAKENDELARGEMSRRRLTPGRNLTLRDELIALRDATAQSYSHAEALKVHWGEVDKAQSNLYHVGRAAAALTAAPTAVVPAHAAAALAHRTRRGEREDCDGVY